MATLSETELFVEESSAQVTVCVELVAQLARDISVYLSTGAENDTAIGSHVATYMYMYANNITY